MRPSTYFEELKMLEDNLYLDNLQEFVQDESMIVRLYIYLPCSIICKG